MHHKRETYWDKIWNLEGYSFEMVFTTEKIMGWASGFLELLKT